MKISIIGPGIMPIPPTGWGAVEILIWDSKNALEKLGHEVQIVNTKDGVEILKQINSFRPDFVHVQYDEFIPLIPYIQYPNAITSHFGYIERREMFNGYINVANEFQKIKPNVFCLSYGIKEIYQKVIQIPQHKLFVTPNGVNIDEFYYTDKPSHGDRSIYLAKIDYRKRQHLFQSISSLWFAGNIADPNFRNDVNYLGEWSKKNLYQNLTNYGNLVLLSDGEAHPLVCMEAFAAGLGVVISQWAAANLDISKEFITVIPEEKINDIKYVEKRMIDNRNYSTTHRQEIREYAKQFDWVSVIEKTYVPTIERIIS